MSVQCEFINGAYFNLDPFVRNTLSYMDGKGHFKGRKSPFYRDEQGQRLMQSAFALQRGDMFVLASYMLQRLFPNLSWKRAWMRKDGQHEAWVATQDIVRLVTFDQRYLCLQAALLEERVCVSDIAEFEFFRRLIGDANFRIEYGAIRGWCSAVFLLMELMRELETYPEHKEFRFA